MQSDEIWMSKVLAEAERRFVAGETPLASILVVGDQEMARAYSHTNAANNGSIHPEMLVLKNVGPLLDQSLQPKVLYTSVEPCPFCFGAWSEAKVDRVVFAVRDIRGGGADTLTKMKCYGRKGPEVVVGIFERQTINLLKRFIKANPNHKQSPYIEDLISSAS